MPVALRRLLIRTLVAALILAVLFLVGIAQAIWAFAFGSDELEHYTAKYTWMANQMSHAMMGFCLMAFFWVFCVRGQPSAAWWNVRRNRVYWPFLILLIKDFLIDPFKDWVVLLDSPLQPDWRNVFFDSITDDLFWFSGFTLALFAIHRWHVAPLRQNGQVLGRSEIHPDGENPDVPTEKPPVEARKARQPLVPSGGMPWLAAFLVLLISGVVCGLFWYPQKDTFDQSGMPLNYERLPILANHLSLPDAQNNTLRDIQKAAVNGKPVNVVIYGGNPRQRADLAVSLGCEYVFRLQSFGFSGPNSVIFLSAAQLLEDPKRIAQLDAIELKCIVVVDLDTSMVPPPDILVEAAWNAQNPELIGGGVRNQLDLVQFLKDHGKDKNVIYSRDNPLSLEDLRILYNAYRDPNKSLKTYRRFEELRLAVQNRTQIFKALGRKARDKGVATIWALAETPAWLGEACDPEVEQRHRLSDREGWIFSLALILGTEEKSLYRIDLRKP